jgi:hypothetical protein
MTYGSVKDTAHLRLPAAAYANADCSPATGVATNQGWISAAIEPGHALACPHMNRGPTGEIERMPGGRDQAVFRTLQSE